MLCVEKNFEPTKNNNKPTTPNCEFPDFQKCCSSDLARKKGRKKIAINSFQKKSIISIMKKKKQNYCSRQRRKGKMKKRYHKKTQAYYQTKKKCDQV